MRRTAVLFIALTFAATPTAGQTQMALAAGAHDPGPLTRVNRALLAAALKPTYSVHLVSAWPQLGMPNSNCVNGGDEVLEGSIEQTSGGNYVGLLQRKATIRFCGIHGPAKEACSLTLQSTGPVVGHGEVRPFTSGWTNPTVELRWTTAEAGNDVTVEGDCPPAFNESLEQMYLGVTHMVEFSLPVVGEGARHEELADFGWIVEVQ